ncbi:Hypothetical protein LUCI_4317 [Lucifera butyrica]|uniref:Uncharacterized protein n=1 Tax=Lucifera butyrica TaxID=1351585 RepID=A0A498RCB6_9FIRM|nr:hypothetical protein [Lucifera butyrica]VBB09031.1 Hypothetical protein LUCI_4317 [Lucifera butyrica]
MHYFRLRQDPDYSRAPAIPEVITRIDRRQAVPEKAHHIAPTTVLPLGGKAVYDFIDLLDRPLFLVSDELQQVLKLYMPKLTFKTIVLADPARKEQHIYYLPIFAPIDCLSDNSLQTPDKRTVKHLVLKGAAIENHTVFRVQHPYETIIIVRLDVAESILRRDLRGIRLDRVKIE